MKKLYCAIAVGILLLSADFTQAQEFTLDLSKISSFDFALQSPDSFHYGQSPQSIHFSVSKPFQCKLDLSSGGVISSSIRFSVSPGGIISEVQALLPEEEGMGGSFVSMSKAEYELAGKGKVLVIRDPPNTAASLNLNFATLKPDLDGNYYLIDNGTLRFKYLERYHDTDGLQFTIYNQNHEPVPVSLSSGQTQVAYGVNWYAWNLKSSPFVQNQSYTLCIQNNKGYLSYLRFVYRE